MIRATTNPGGLSGGAPNVTPARTIRAAVPADLPALAAVEVSAAIRYDGTGIAAGRDTVPMDELAIGMVDRLLWIADAGAGPVGFLLARPEDGGLYVRELSVALASQGRGLGGALLTAALDAARHRRLPSAMLTTFRDLPWTRPFYERHGFHVATGLLPPALAAQLARVAAAFGPDAHACAMIRHLEPAA